MTNATKTLAVIFAGTIALALATSWNWSSTSSAAFQGNLLDVDTSAVQAVQIDRSDGPSIRLERANGNWRVAPADTSARYPASPEAVSDLLDSFSSLQVDAVTTRQSDKYPRYGVDSTGTTVTMFGGGDQTLGQLIVGRTQVPRPDPQMNRRQAMQQMRNAAPTTYVRPPNETDVYAVSQSLRSVSTRQVEGWRQKQIWALDRAQIQRIDFTLPGDSSFTMERAASGDEGSSANRSTWLSAGDTLKAAVVSSVLRTLSTPTADGFVEGASPDNFGEARYTVRLQTTDGSDRAIRLRPGADDHYVAAADGFPYVVQFSKRKWDNSVLQGRSALLKRE